MRTGRRAGSRSTIEVAPTLGQLAAQVASGAVAMVCIDMPIGLPERGARACDRAARSLLGSRACTVFPAPPRSCLGAPDHITAVERARAATGHGVSVQAFHLLAKIAELDELLSAQPTLTERIVEAHPECCFASLLGGPAAPKRRGSGRVERLEALLPLVSELEDWLRACPEGARPDDVLDAAVLAWTARRHLAGRTTVLGDGALDATGLPMQIVC